MFELTQEHRKMVCIELEKAFEEKAQLLRHLRIEEQKIKIANETDKTRDPFMMAGIQMDQFLIDQRISAIRKALIDNEIDF